MFQYYLTEEKDVLNTTQVTVVLRKTSSTFINIVKKRVDVNLFALLHLSGNF